MNRIYTERENIFMAKKLLTELVYNSAYIEGCNVTFPQTQTIIDGAVISGVSVDDIQTVLNLRDAWKYLLQTYNDPLTVEYLCKMNGFVSRNESLEWGVLRSGSVGVAMGEGNYIPELPDQAMIVKKLEEIAKIMQPQEQAIQYFAFGCKQQLFWDGNKRTSTLVANKILINQGCGLLSIGEKNAQDFNESLSHFYLSDDLEPLKKCLKRCMDDTNKKFAFNKVKDKKTPIR